MARSLNTIEFILVVALIIALLCSIVICYYVYVLKDNHYRDGFSTWQMPMIFAIIADLYLIK
jgi:Na+-transporting NADH:ubiquinone oxidoreductase subunit NqrC